MNGLVEVEKDGPYTVEPPGVSFHNKFLDIFDAVVYGFMHSDEFHEFAIGHVEGLCIELPGGF